MNNNPGIISAFEGNQFHVDIWGVSDNAGSPSGDYLYKSMDLSESVYDFRIGSATRLGAPTVLSGAPMCSQTYHNHSPHITAPVIRDLSYSASWLECPPWV